MALWRISDPSYQESHSLILIELQRKELLCHFRFRAYSLWCRITSDVSDTCSLCVIVSWWAWAALFDRISLGLWLWEHFHTGASSSQNTANTVDNHLQRWHACLLSGKHARFWTHNTCTSFGASLKVLRMISFEKNLLSSKSGIGSQIYGLHCIWLSFKQFEATPDICKACQL